MNKTLINAAFALAFGTVMHSAHAASVNNGDTLTIYAGVASYDSNGNFINVSSGSWFGMDFNGSGTITGFEKTALSQGNTGLVIGMTTYPGASHFGAPTASDTNAITAPWEFFGSTGSDYTTVAITGSTTAGLNMSGWTIAWSGISAIYLGSGAWGTGFSNGIGNFVWDGVMDHSYTLDYHATVPVGDPSGFGGVKYALHLKGCGSALDVICIDAPLSPTPEVSTYGMMLVGLGLVGVAARRRKQAEV